MSLASPKSHIFTMLSSANRTFLAAKSLCMYCVNIKVNVYHVLVKWGTYITFSCSSLPSNCRCFLFDFPKQVVSGIFPTQSEPSEPSRWCLVLIRRERGWLSGRLVYQLEKFGWVWLWLHQICESCSPNTFYFWLRLLLPCIWASISEELNISLNNSNLRVIDLHQL